MLGSQISSPLTPAQTSDMRRQARINSAQDNGLTKARISEIAEAFKLKLQSLQPVSGIESKSPIMNSQWLQREIQALPSITSQEAQAFVSILTSNATNTEKTWSLEKLISKVEKVLAQNASPVEVQPEVLSRNSTSNPKEEFASAIQKLSTMLGESKPSAASALNEEALKANEVLRNISSIIDRLNTQAPTATSEDSKSYFSSFVAPQDRAINTEKLTKAIAVAQSVLNDQPVNAKTLESALQTIKTFAEHAE